MRCRYLHIIAWQVIFIILYTTIDNEARRKKIALPIYTERQLLTAGVPIH